MYSNLGSSLLTYWADFLQFVLPKSHPQKETPLMITKFYTPEELTEKIKERAFQLEMIDWVDTYLRPLENDAIYLQVCQDRRSTVQPFTTIAIKKILDVMEPFVILGTPAHELGHHVFDGFGGSAIISNDPFIAKAYHNEIDSAFFGAMLHDSSTGIQHRYIDNEWELNHGEIAAWIFYHITEGLAIEPIRRLTAYAIAAHPHMLKEMTVKNGGVRKPWNDKLFFYGDHPIRIAVWVTRWTDRLENGGDAAAMLPRHALASLDGARINGLDLTGVNWYSFKDSIKYLFVPNASIMEDQVLNQDGSPQIKDGQPVIMKSPSMLKHLQNYANSATAYPYSAYNQHDHRSPNMVSLMGWKTANSAELISKVTNRTEIPDFELFVQQMKMKSGYPNTQMTLDTIEMVRELWNHSSPEDQAHWAAGFEFAYVSYFDWLHFLTNQIAKATNPTIIAFQPLIPELMARVTKI